MLAYLLRRLLLIIPTLFGILALNFFIIQVAPGGPVEQLLAKIQGNAQATGSRITGGGSEVPPESRPIRLDNGLVSGPASCAPNVPLRSVFVTGKLTRA